jgi:hypothetical protein
MNLLSSLTATDDLNADPVGEKFYGKYRGTVINNVDPMQIGRIQVMVPGAGVWIEFEQGDPDYPIWTGCYWGSAAEVPLLSHLAPPGTPAITLQTVLQNGMIISDLPGLTGGVILKSASGATLIVNDTGIYIQNGKGASIVLVGPTVTVNTGALTVT